MSVLDNYDKWATIEEAKSFLQKRLGGKVTNKIIFNIVLSGELSLYIYLRQNIYTVEYFLDSEKPDEDIRLSGYYSLSEIKNNTKFIEALADGQEFQKYGAVWIGIVLEKIKVTIKIPNQNTRINNDWLISMLRFDIKQIKSFLAKKTDNKLEQIQEQKPAEEQTKIKVSKKELGNRERNNLHKVIAALLVANNVDKQGAYKTFTMLDHIAGINSIDTFPSKDTVAKFIQEAQKYLYDTPIDENAN